MNFRSKLLRAADEPRKTRWEAEFEQEDRKWLDEAYQRELKEKWVEYVPISAMMPYREYHWGEYYNRHGREEFVDMVEDMKRHGVRSPITLKFFRDANMAYIEEGNHRLAAAYQAGLKEIPVRVHVSGLKWAERGRNSYADSHGAPVPGLKDPNERIYADYIKPSDIGLPGHK